MGRIGVSYEEVATAAQEVQGKGKSPTVDNVRLVIGTGSKSTIARHLRDWRNQQGIARGSDGAIPSELLGLVKGLWERLRDTVEQKGYEYQCESDEKVKQIQQQLIQSHQQHASLQVQYHQLEEKWHQQTKTTNELQDALAFEQKEKAKIAERSASQESHRQEQQSEIERLHQLLKHVQNNLEHYQNTTQQLRQEQALHNEKQHNEYEQRLSVLQQQMTSISAEKLSYQARYEQTNQALENVQLKQDALSQVAHEAQTKYHLLSQEYARLAQQYQNQSNDLETKKQSVIETQIKLATYVEKINTLEKSLVKADDKIQILRDNFSFISQEKANLEGQIKQFQQGISLKQAESL